MFRRLGSVEERGDQPEHEHEHEPDHNNDDDDDKEVLSHALTVMPNEPPYSGRIRPLIGAPPPTPDPDRSHGLVTEIGRRAAPPVVRH